MATAAQSTRAEKEAEILSYLVAGLTPTEAAARANRSATTVYRMLTRADFSARLHEARALELRPHVAKLVSGLSRAIDKMLVIMDDPDVVPSTQLRAAVSVAELTLKFHDHLELAPRLTALEARIGVGEFIPPADVDGN